MGCAKFYVMDSSLISIQRDEHARVALRPLPSRRASHFRSRAYLPQRS